MQLLLESIFGCLTAPLGRQTLPQCSPLWLWRHDLPDTVTPRIYDEIVARGLDKGTPLFIGPDTQSMTIEFHDLNAGDAGG
jgi:hypothetical protein